MDKQALRKAVREKKRAMTEEQIREASLRLGELFLRSEMYQQAKTLYGYLPYNQEVRTTAMLQQALSDGKRVAVPKIYGDEMKFIFLDDLSQVEKGYAGIPEPIADGPVADDKTALVLMPGLAFTTDGKRMGYGGGFYDRLLAGVEKTPVAVLYSCQLAPSLPCACHDLPMGIIVTENKVLYC